MSVQPKLLYQPQELAGSATVRLRHRRGRVDTDEGLVEVSCKTTLRHRRWIHPSNTNPDIFSGAIVGLLMKVHQPKSKHHPLNDQYDAD